MDWSRYKPYYKIFGITLAVALSITGYMVAERQSYKSIEIIGAGTGAPGQKLNQPADGKSEVVPKTLLVQISGCVKEPGIYTMQEGQRVIDAIELAGGAVMEIDDKSINLVARVRDGQKIYFQPRKIDGVERAESVNNQENSESNTEKTARTVEKININTAGLTELKRLPGIGDYYARKIIDYRKVHGPFPDAASIIKVSGIGPSRYEQIKAYITVK